MDLTPYKPIPAPNKETLETKIAQFKEMAINKALQLMQLNGEYMETKEFKDLVAVVDMIDKSTRPEEQQNVNILVNNLVREFIEDV